MEKLNSVPQVYRHFFLVGSQQLPLTRGSLIEWLEHLWSPKVLLDTAL